MGRSPCCVKEGLNKGAWTAMEDKILMEYVMAHGEGIWRSLPKKAGLKRCGKSCRLRWLNYLRPDIKRGNITPDEEELIIRLHKLLGNRWSLIAGRLPGRTDNEIKNYWNTNLSKRVNQPLSDLATTHPKKSRSDPTNKKTRTMNEPKLATQAIKSNVVRTKAVRCTKLFINIEPQLQPNSCNHAYQNDAMNNYSMVPIVQPICSTNNFNGDSKVDNNSSTKLNDQENITPSDLVMKEFTHIGDFDLISEFLNSDFSSEFYLNNECNNNSCAYSLSPSSSEMPPSFSELLENWLGDEQAIDVGSA